MHCCGYPRQMSPLWWLPIEFCRLRFAATTTMTGLSIPWCCPSMIHTVFLCDANHPLFLVVWSSVAYHDDRHGWTMIAWDASWLTVNALDVQRGYRLGATHIRLFVLSVWYARAFFCSICFQRHGFASPDPPSSSSIHIYRAVLTRQATSRV